MRRKPWPIILLSFLYLIFPIFNIFATYLHYRHEANIIELLESLFLNPENFLAVFNIFVPSILAAIAVYKVRKWSFAVVFICTLWLAISMMREYSSELSMWTIILGIVIPILINIALASYILIPNVYAVYRDSMIRWWERESRYEYKTPVEIKFENKIVDANLINLSKGGCFVVSNTEILHELIIKINMSVLEIPLELKAKIGHIRNQSEGFGYGLQFLEMSNEDLLKLKNIMKKFNSLKYPLTNPLPDWKEDFRFWFNDLVTTGKGITPQIPDEYKNRKK